MLNGCIISFPSPQPAPEQYEALTKELAETNRQLTAIAEKLQRQNELPSGGALTGLSRPGNTGSAALLAKIEPLKTGADDAAILRFLNRIKIASMGQNAYSPTDPQVTLLKSIGPGHLALLLPFVSDAGFYHLTYALPALVNDDDKDLLLKSLAGNPRLLSVIVARGWANEAKATILGMLKNGNSGWEIAQAIPQLRLTAEEEKEVIHAYETVNNMSQLFAAVQGFANVDLTAISNRAWEGHRYSQPWERNQYALRAAERGNVEALGALIRYVAVSPGDDAMHWDGGNLRGRLVAFTGQSADAKKMLAWFEENKANIFFDVVEKRFKVR